MEIRIWGTWGSVPVSSPETLRYAGAAYEHEFDGRARSTTNGYSLVFQRHFSVYPLPALLA